MKKGIKHITILITAFSLISMLMPVISYAGTYTSNSDFDQGVMNAVNHTAFSDQLQLDRIVKPFPYAWVANSADGTVSKIDTRTGVEVARYQTGANPTTDSPSRTAIDNDGNCWVANRANGNGASGLQGTIIKIAMNPTDLTKPLTAGIDHNGNGTIETSTGPSDVKPWVGGQPQDEAIVIWRNVGNPGGLPRALAIDPATGNIWVGLYNEARYSVLDPATGNQIYSVSTPHPSYGAAIYNGILWNAVVSWGVDKIDVATRTYLGSANTGGGYGIVGSPDGKAWLGAYTGQGLFRIENNLTFTRFNSNGYTAGRGVCIKNLPDNPAQPGKKMYHVWLSLGYGSPNNRVAKYDQDGVLLGTFVVGTNPNGVAVDYDGNIIVVCQDTNDVFKLDEATGAQLWRTPVGRTPYTYSDFTGYNLGNDLQRSGTWTIVQDSQSLGTKWGKATWNTENPLPAGSTSEPAGTSIIVEVRAADKQSDLPTQPWLQVFNGILFNSVAGRYIEVKVTLSTTVDTTPVLTDIRIDSQVCGHIYPDGMYDDSTLYPVVDGKAIGNVLTIYPGDKPSAGADWQQYFSPKVDPSTGQQEIDQIDGQLSYMRNWYHFVPNANGSKGIRQVPVKLQSVTLEKIIPVRKSASSGTPWIMGKNTQTLFDGKLVVSQTEYPGKISDLIQGEWPLLYEVDGTEFRLTVRYSTDILVQDSCRPASKIHIITYHWFVNSHRVTVTNGLVTGLKSINERISAFRRLPFSTNEVVAMTFCANKGLANFIIGYGIPNTVLWNPGFIYWANTKNRSLALNQLTAGENYVDGVSSTDGWYHSAIYAINNDTPCPLPGDGEAIVENSTCPAASMLINDIWAVMNNIDVKLLLEK